MSIKLYSGDELVRMLDVIIPAARMIAGEGLQLTKSDANWRLELRDIEEAELDDARPDEDEKTFMVLFAGGANRLNSLGNEWMAKIQYFDPSSESTNVKDRGDLTEKRGLSCGSASNATAFWFGGTRSGLAQESLDTVDSVDWATNGQNAVDRGNLVLPKTSAGATDDGSFAFIGGGYGPGDFDPGADHFIEVTANRGLGTQTFQKWRVTDIQRFEFATNTSSLVGDFSRNKSRCVAGQSSTKGYYQEKSGSQQGGASRVATGGSKAWLTKFDEDFQLLDPEDYGLLNLSEFDNPIEAIEFATESVSTLGFLRNGRTGNAAESANGKTYFSGGRRAGQYARDLIDDAIVVLDDQVRSDVEAIDHASDTNNTTDKGSMVLARSRHASGRGDNTVYWSGGAHASNGGEQFALIGDGTIEKIDATTDTPSIIDAEMDLDVVDHAGSSK